MRQASAHASSGAANSASLMKDTQAASGFLQFSRTVPVSDVNLVPHARHLHRWSPDAETPSRRAPPSPHSGQAGSGLYSSAASASVPKPSSSRSLRSSTASDRSSNSAGVSDPTSPA